MNQSILEIIEGDDNFRSILENMIHTAISESFNGIMITDKDAGYTILHVNPAFCTMTGYTAAELIGKSPAILQGEHTDQSVLDRLRSDLEQGNTFHGQTINYRKDGSEFMMEWKIAPIRNHKKEISHFMAIQREVG